MSSRSRSRHLRSVGRSGAEADSALAERVADLERRVARLEEEREVVASALAATLAAAGQPETAAREEATA